MNPNDLITELNNEKNRQTEERWRLYGENLRLRSVIRMLSSEFDWLSEAPSDRLATRLKGSMTTVKVYRKDYDWAFNDQDMPERR